ncbi:MAG: hypothetical protein ACRCX2_22695 [Paraclostridium sp.]
MGSGTFFAVNERILKSLKVDNDSIEKIKKMCAGMLIPYRCF